MGGLRHHGACEVMARIADHRIGIDDAVEFICVDARGADESVDLAGTVVDQRRGLLD
jgi:hypothetical protein